jgi:ATP:ADP antiporter, AAA family
MAERPRGFARLTHIAPAELKPALWSFAYFFLLLAGYYVLRPVRDEMGIAGGIEQLPWVFTGTFVAMLAAVPIFGFLSARLPRRRFLPLVYGFFVVNILVFYALFQSGVQLELVARAFFIWTSVYNLFVVSVFWSFMVDLYSNAQARRLFGFIAAGGSVGAVVGPALTALLAKPLGTFNLLLISALFLTGAIVCIYRLLALSAPGVKRDWLRGVPTRERPLGGGIWAGVGMVARSPYLLGIGLFIWLYTTTSTFLYFEQAHIVRAAYDDSASRTALFAGIDLVVNGLTILLQLLLTARLIRLAGIAGTLVLIPLLSAVGFAVLGLWPTLAALVVFQIVRRAGEYALTRPAREVLYTVLTPEAKYKAKNVIDTVVYRGGDAVSAWGFAGLQALGVGLAGIAWLGIPLSFGWAATAWWLGRREAQEQRRLGKASAA